MSHNDVPAYGLWSLVIINSAIFIMFAYSFAPPKTSRDWRSFSAFSAFLVALFAEMYGYPLTIYLLSGWLTTKFPGVNWLSHDAGHLLETMVGRLFGWKVDPHFGPFHIASQVLIFGGFILTAVSWKILYAAQKAHQLAVTGPYARIRHPQYVGFVLVMTGFLLQWPTIITLAMYPILVTMYVRLALHEERDAQIEFGAEYERYAAQVPRFFPRFGRPRQPVSGGEHHAH
ncbi:MAG: isoprenylcysteine carboxylmethyltransferase family protein [Nevskia sp.]|nr:isoprenylcysteine carboxylmethyltransferase family protein [Nevskia sp.]